MKRRRYHFRNSIGGLFVLLLLATAAEMFPRSPMQSCGVKVTLVSCTGIDANDCHYSFSLDVTNNTGASAQAIVTVSGLISSSNPIIASGATSPVSGMLHVPCGTSSLPLTVSLGSTTCNVTMTLPQCSCTSPAIPGAIACTGMTGTPCPANHEVCAGLIVNLTDPNTPGPNCTRRWYQWNGSAWQAILGATGAAATLVQTLTSSACPFTLANFRVVYSCPQCPDTFSDISFKVYSPSQGGTITGPAICDNDGDKLTLSGECGDIKQWESSPTGIVGSFAPIAGSGLAHTFWTNGIPPHDRWYRVLIQNGPCGSAYSNVFQVTLNHKPNPTISAGSPVTFCAPGSAMLTAANPNGGTCDWYQNGLQIGTGMSWPASTSGNYYVICSNSCGKTKSNTITVKASKPVAVIAGACGVCVPNCVSLNALFAGGVLPYSWVWSTGQPGNPISVCPTTNTNYSVTVTDAIGCTTTATHNVDVCPIPLVANAGKNITTCPGGSVTIGGTPSASGGTGNYTYSWSPATGLSSATIANPLATPNQTTAYTLTVTDATTGCVKTSTIVVTVKGPPC